MKEKSILLTAALLAGMMLAGCSHEDEEKFTIMVKEIQLTVGGSQKVETSGGFTAHSTDEQVATVSADGTITAVSAGEADVVFTSTEYVGQQQTCHVTADWRYHYFEEPIIAFGATKDEIKAMESHEIIKERDNYIVYEYPCTEMTMSASYTFDDNGDVFQVILGIRDKAIKRTWSDDFLQQLEERYGSYSEDKNGHKVFIPKNGNYKVVLNFPNIDYITSTE